MTMRRSKAAAPLSLTQEPGGVDRRRLMRLGGAAAAGAAGAVVVGLGDAPSPASAAPPPPRSGVVVMTSTRHTVAVPGGLTRRSRVLATVNSDPDQLGYFPVVAAAPDPANGTITLRLNSFSPQGPGPEVAWLVIDET